MNNRLGWRRVFAAAFLVASVALVCGLLLALPGCESTTLDRLAFYEAQMSQARSVIDTVDAQLGPTMEVLADLELRLSEVEAETPGSAVALQIQEAMRETRDAISAAYEKKGQALAVIETAEEEVERLRGAGANAGIGEELMAIGAVGQAVAPATGPAAFWVGLVSAAVSGIGSLIVGGTALKRPGDVTAAEAKAQADSAWDEADAKAFERGLMAGMTRSARALPTAVETDS